MGIAKEIFGLEYKKLACSHFTIADGYNQLLSDIDKFEISEEAILDILQDVAPHPVNRKISAAIKANANKIFVRRGK